VQVLPKRKPRPSRAGRAGRTALAGLVCSASLSLAAHAPAARAETPAPAPPAKAPAALVETKLDVHQFRVAESYSGSTSYYRIVEDPAEPFLRAVYRPPLETVTLGFEVPEQLRTSAKKLRWKWRAMVLPKGGDECKSGFTDSAAVVYVMWKRGFKWYALKYVWSAVGKKGQICDQKRNLFVVQDTIIRQTGGPTGVWMTEEIDPAAEFRAHFENGDANAEVPAFVGIGIMSDGDQTKSVSAADYTGFVILH
jgi:hypothetical protein